MPEKKKQHYVPKFYLKLFSGSSEKSINLYNINKCLNIKDANLKNQCYEPYFYGKNLVIENTFGTIETAVSGIINGINNSNLVPKYFSKQHHAILTYVLLQYARTKYSALAYDEFTDKFCKLIIEKDKKLSKEELDKVIISNKDPIGFQLKIMAQSIPLAMDLHVKVLSNKTKIDFITSDNPVVLYNQACERSTVGSNTGLASKGLQVFFPISPKKIIVFFDSKIYKIGKRKCSISSIVTETDVAQLNRRVAK